MVDVVRMFRCHDCKREHFTYEEARSCETGHIALRGIEDFEARLRKIFSKDAPHDH